MQPTKNKDTARESLQDFATAVQQLAYHSYPTLPEGRIRREADKVFADGVEDPDIKIQLLLGGQKTVDEALRRALELQAILLATRPHKMSTMTFWEIRSPPTQQRDARKSICWSCGEPGHFGSNCPYRMIAESDHRCKPEDKPSREMWESPRRSEWLANNNEETNRRGSRPSGNEQGLVEKGGPDIYIEAHPSQVDCHHGICRS